MLNQARKNIEKKLGLPPMEQISKMLSTGADKESMALYVQVLQSIPDAVTLREFNKVLVSLERFSKTAPDLNLVIELLTLLKDINFDEINQAIGELQKVVKQLPKEGLDVLAALAKDSK